MFVDVMSPLKSLIESSRGWDSGVFGTYAASEYILNVCGFLIVAGIILDKMGIRFTGVLSASLMVIGAGIKYIGISDWFQATAFCGWLDSWWTAMPGSAKMVVDCHAGQRQDGCPRIHGLRMRMRNGRYHSVKGDSQMVQGQGNGPGDGT